MSIPRISAINPYKIAQQYAGSNPFSAGYSAAQTGASASVNTNIFSQLPAIDKISFSGTNAVTGTPAVGTPGVTGVAPAEGSTGANTSKEKWQGAPVIERGDSIYAGEYKGKENYLGKNLRILA